MQRALKIEDLFAASGLTRARTLWRLADAYRLDGREPEAIGTIEKLLASEDLLLDDRIGVIRDYASMLIIGGTPGKALDEINRQLVRLTKNQKGDNLPLLLIRSRVHAALKDWNQADHDVSKFIEAAPKPSIAYSDFAEACLFRGFLLDRRGRKDEALTAWRAGLRKHWPKQLPILAPNDRLLDGKGLRDNSRALLYFAMLASLVGELELDESNSIVTESMGSGDFTLAPIVKFFDSFRNNSLIAPGHIRAIVLEMYKSRFRSRFRQERASFLEISIQDEFNRPLMLAVGAEIRLNAIPEGGEPGLAELIDSGLEEISRLVQEGRFTPRQLMMMLSAWSGTAGFLGWSGLEASLKDGRELRGKIAYVYGRRFLALKQPETARRLFQLTRTDLPAQSPFSESSLRINLTSLPRNERAQVGSRQFGRAIDLLDTGFFQR